MTAVFLTYPLQVLRSRLQDARGDTTGKLYDKGLAEAVIRVYTREGLLGYYKGIFASLLKIVPSSMITLVIYERVLKSLAY